MVIVALLQKGTSGISQSEIKCIKSYYAQDQQTIKVTSNDGATWLEMEKNCQNKRPGYSLSTQFQSMTEEEMVLCPIGSLVPIGKVNEDDAVEWSRSKESLEMLENLCANLSYAIKKAEPGINAFCAFHWPNLEPRLVDKETKFHCALCQMSTRFNVLTQAVYPPHNNSDYEYDLELVSYHQINDIGLVANGSDLVNRLLDDLAEAFNISVSSLHWHNAKLNEDQKAVVHVYYDRSDANMDWKFYVHWNDEYLDHQTVANFDITMIKISTECKDSKKRLINGHEKTQLTGAIDIRLNILDTTITSRECYWDELLGAVWSEAIIWKINWELCDMMVSNVLKMYNLPPKEFEIALWTVDIHLAFALKYESKHLTTEQLEIAYLILSVNGYIVLHTQNMANASVSRLLSYSMPLSLARLYMAPSLKIGRPTKLIRFKHVKMIIAENQTINPVTGLALHLPSRENISDSAMQLNHDNMTMPLNTSHIVVTVSDSIAFYTNRLAIVTYAAHLDYPETQSLDISLGSWMSLVQVTYIRNSSQDRNFNDDYIDIAFKPNFREPTQRGKCAERDFATDEWITDNCRILKSLRDDMLVCRCQKIYHELEMTSGAYLIYGFDASLSTYLANHKSLVIVIVFVCIMSFVGVLSVILTAICFPEWRKDHGHQIFLQMIFSLTVNLVIGFFNNFSFIESKSVACVAIGVVRHYSFLAMFFWMMILSGLQVKRLTTISGAKATSHLILKVSSIAWGLPIIPIVILLSWDVGFYKSEVSNRGYCYPEGLAFQVTVQAPAGFILVANMFIFMIILNHIYGWFKFGNEIEVRKHTNDRAEQLRRLGTSIFIFFLFGFTWVFHFLSEEGIINSEFLFEFMFLITASFHLFMLSLFFILLDKRTRILWQTYLCGK